MSKAIVIREYGGPEILQLESVQVGNPGKGELRIRQTCLGVNFHDVYVRSGLYKTLALPGVPGIEGVGVVEDIGSDVEGFVVGDRVTYITSAYGGYASERILAADIAVKLPETIDDETAASVFLKGLTVDMLVNSVGRIQPGDQVLVQAAAGGVGQLLSQWASHLGATVIGTAGSAEKAEIARKAGCSHVILYRQEKVAESVKAITAGRGVNVAFDSVGKDTFAGSLDSLALCGHLVNFGQSSGPVEPVALTQLSIRSTSLTRPMLFHYTARRWRLAAAHAFLESRQATTPVVLTV
ncbi:quinone oxidoreductase [Variovorax humicola]|uniref:Quinone oxidoreductase n=1 Tax=Variovorax humicola TaxID=1769758 RepID=A0ABU8W4A3_9BURK